MHKDAISKWQKFKFEPRTMALKNKLAKIIKFKKLPQLWNLNIFNTHGCKELKKTTMHTTYKFL
jgi:hypothetical protein